MVEVVVVVVGEGDGRGGEPSEGWDRASEKEGARTAKMPQYRRSSARESAGGCVPGHTTARSNERVKKASRVNGTTERSDEPENLIPARRLFLSSPSASPPSLPCVTVIILHALAVVFEIMQLFVLLDDALLSRFSASRRTLCSAMIMRWLRSAWRDKFDDLSPLFSVASSSSPSIRALLLLSRHENDQ